VSADLVGISFDALDPGRVARFWSGLLGWELTENPDDDIPMLLPNDDTGFELYFLPTDRPKAGPNQAHFDLTSTSLENQRETVARALDLGATPIDVGQGPDALHVVLADPEGNEFCVIEPGNRFLADCGFLGAVACDGSQAVGYFWSAALGWPLVWDENGETAIRSPRGGPKISWGGPPIPPKSGKNRVHLDIAPPPGGDQDAEVERLLGLGATHADIGQGDVYWVVMADPDGNEFCVLKPQAST